MLHTTRNMYKGQTYIHPQTKQILPALIQSFHSLCSVLRSTASSKGSYTPLGNQKDYYDTTPTETTSHHRTNPLP